MNKKVLALILLISWICIIANLSSEVGTVSMHRGVETANLVKSYISIDDDDVLIFIIRKTGHAAVYFILTLLMHTFIRCLKPGRNKAFMLAGVLAILCACLDEYNQLYTSGRDGTFVDVFIDSIGIMAALTVNFLVSQISARLYQKS